MKTNKTFAMFAVAASMTALVSCQKEETFVPVQEEGISTITLTIEQPSDEDATKTVLGTETSGSYPVNWSAGDKIAVKSQSGNTFEEYTLSSGEGSTSGTFTGTSISGAVYAYYPYSGVTEVQSNIYKVNLPAQQAYKAGSFAESALPMYGIANSTGELHSLKPLMSVLKIPLKGTFKVSRIVVVSSAGRKLSGKASVNFTATTATMTVEDNDYVELICAPAVQLNESTATLFHIAIPAAVAGEYKVTVITDDNKMQTKTLTVSTAFTAGKMKKTAELTGLAPANVFYGEGSSSPQGLNVAGRTWAPVNCGYEATNYTYGKLYQWGRAVGGGYNDDGAYTETVIQVANTNTPSGTNTNPDDNVFYKPTKSPWDWYTKTTAIQLSSWPMKSTDADFVANKIANPCPAGWRVPTEADFTALKNANSTWVTGKNVAGDGTGSFNGRLFGTSPNLVFFPASGYRQYSDGGASSRNTSGYYWSSKKKSTYAKCLYLNSGSVTMEEKKERANGYTVRCVKD